jgi:hypothetical protein
VNRTDEIAEQYVPEALELDPIWAAEAAGAATAEFGEFLLTDLLPLAPERDAVGRERYELALRGHPMAARVRLACHDHLSFEAGQPQTSPDIRKDLARSCRGW